MDDTLRLAAAILAVMASGVGVAVAIDQLTLRTRLRKTEAWASDSAAKEIDEHRGIALEAVRLRSVAALVASHAIPARHFVAPVVFALVPLALLVAAFQRGEAVAPDLVALLTSSSLASVGACRVAVRLHLERRRVANAYVAGGVLVPAPRLTFLEQIEGGVRAEWGAGLALAFGLHAPLVGAGMLLRDPEALVGPVLILAGGVAIGWAVSRVKRLGNAA